MELGGIVSFLKTLVSHSHGFNSSSLPTFIPTCGMGTNGNSEVDLRMSLRESPGGSGWFKDGFGYDDSPSFALEILLVLGV